MGCLLTLVDPLDFTQLERQNSLGFACALPNLRLISIIAYFWN